MEKLGQVARQDEAWLEEQKKLLRESDLEEVKSNTSALPAQKDTIRVVVRYLENNTFQMDYKSYLQEGLWLGTGAMESAHRRVT